MKFPVLFFAAGLGTRMGTLTKDRPKPLINVGGRSLLDHALALADLSEIGAKVINIHYRAEMIRAHLAGQEVLFSDETDALLETGGGLRKALPLLGPGPVMTMNTDAVWKGPNPFAILAAHWDPDRMDALLLLLDRDDALGHSGTGDFLPDADGRLHRGPGLVYSGAQIINPKDLDDIPDPAFSLNRVWDKMIERGKLFGIRYPGKWCDVGRPDSIPLAEELIEGRSAI